MKRQSALNRSTSSKVFHGTRHQEEFDRQTEKRTIIFEVYNVESLHAPNRVPIVDSGTHHAQKQTASSLLTF